MPNGGQGDTTLIPPSQSRLGGHPPLLDLPYELFLMMFTHMDVNDILNLLFTCRPLYSRVRDESIWRELSARYGFSDISIYTQQSFFVVYASLLHAYGPLLGLWASDHPFTGNIIEFRLVEEPGPGPIILGEVWRFQSHVIKDSDPKLPEYLEIVRIRPQWNEFGSPLPPEFEWFSITSMTSVDELPVSLALLAPTRQSIYFRYRDYNTSDISTTPHPDFPSSDALWFDHERPLPRLKQEPCEEITNAEIDEDLDDCVLTFLTDTVKPPALAFFPTSTSDVSHFHYPLLTVPDLRLSHRDEGDEKPRASSRYYPLRFPSIDPHLYRDPGDEDWSREGLDGLWIGANGAHDSEVLLVDSSEPEETKAWKITGTMHIPRGITCWRFNPDDAVGISEITPEMEFGDIPLTSRIFSGLGHICPEGFMYVLSCCDF